MDIALIGAGVIGRTHAVSIAQIDELRLSAVVDPFEGGAALANEHGAVHLRELDALIAGPLPDAAIVATPNDLHVPQALALVAAGVPVLVEKPIASTEADAMALVTASEAAGVPVLVGHHRRFHPALQRARALVADGTLGRVTAVSATYFLAKPDDYFVGWHREAGSGGVFLINLIHEIDLLRFLVGEIEQVTALASHATRGLDVEDAGAIAFGFAGGAVGTLILSDAAAGPWSWDLTAADSDRFPAHPVESHRIGGTEAALTIPTLDVWRHDGERSWTTPMTSTREHVEWDDPYVAQLRHLAAVVRGEEAPLVTARDGARNLQVMEAVRTSAATGRAVRLLTAG